MGKPKYLYHASAAGNIEQLKPRSITMPQGFCEGPVVFATDCFAFATQFIVSSDDSWANGGAIGGVYFFVISDKARFSRVDKGGCVYLVPSVSFNKYNKREWYSKKTVKVVSKVCFDSGLGAMIINDVQVYFVAKSVYKKIQASSDHGAKILNGLPCENEKWGLRVEKFDIYRGSKEKI